MPRNIKELAEAYQKKRDSIKARLDEFSNAVDWSENRIFLELSFCICTPQSKAIACWNAISSLDKNGLLYDGNEEQVRPYLKDVRFANKKTKYILNARDFFSRDGKLRINRAIKKKIDGNDVNELRDWLVKNVKGLGMKEASHFLRNVGLGRDFAILDRHIIKSLEKFGVIRYTPKTLSKKTYLRIESDVRRFSDKIEIPMDELDLLLWSEETGEIFK